MTVTLVEQPARPSAPAATPDDASAAEPAAPPTVEPTVFEVELAAAAGTPLAIPDFLRLDDPLASLGAPSDALRKALERGMRCRSASENTLKGAPADCPSTSETYAAMADLRGLTSDLFLDAALAPREGPPELWIGPVASTISLESTETLSGSEPAIMLRSRMTLPPRGPGPNHAPPV